VGGGLRAGVGADVLPRPHPAGSWRGQTNILGFEMER
jgi:hypothetical protein